MKYSKWGMLVWLRRFIPGAVLGGWILLPLSAAWGQSTAGTISGTVTDSTGAVIPGAEVTVKNADTGLNRVLRTGEQGRYVAPQLTLGNYEVAASAQGFQTEVHSGITLAVGQEAVVNFTLKVGAVTEKIEVTGEAPLVETTTSTTSGLVDEKTVRELPLNGRSFTDLMDLQPNVKNVAGIRGTSPNMGYGAHFSVAGSHPEQNLYLIDGLNTSDGRVSTPGSATGNVLGTDTIREFRMLTANYSAEFGQVSGGVMTAVTKSGTNTLHGSVFEFLRNSLLDARNFFDRDPSNPTVRSDPPPFRRNQFGFTLGGPLRKDRFFYFGSYEGLRQRLGTTQILGLPTPAARRGFLPSGPCVSGCAVGLTAQKILNLYPVPNATDHRDGTADFITAPTTATREDYFTARLDRTLGEKHFLFGRYTFDDARVDAPQPVGLFLSSEASRFQNVALNFTSVLNPTLLNTFRAGINRMLASNPSKALHPGVSAMEFISGRGAGQVIISGVTPGITGSAGNTVGPPDPRAFWWTGYQYGDDLTYTRGNHAMKFGLSLQRNQDNNDTRFVYSGQYQFSSLADFFAERPQSMLSATPLSDAERGFRSWIIGTYLQDDWKVLPTLTLNLGMRLEWVPVPTEANHKIATISNIFNDKTTTVGGAFWEQEAAFAHVSPRLGFAWDPFGTGKTAFRGGVGIFQEAIRNFDFILPGTRMFPFYVTTSLTNLPGASLVFPDAFANFGRPGLPPIIPRLDTLDFHIQQPYKTNWSFSVQREIFPHTLVNIGYIGGRGVHLLGSLGDANSPPNVVGADGRRYIPQGTPRRNTNFTQIRYRHSGNDSYYHSLQVSVQKRFSHGFQVSSSYTWSKSIDTNSIRLSQGPEFGNADQEAFPFDTKANRGLSSWDIRHYWSTNYTLELPFGPGKALGSNLTGIGGKFLEGWTLSGVLTLNSGPPFSPILGTDYAGALPQTITQPGQKPDWAPGARFHPVRGGADQYFDPLAFVLPPLTPDCATPGATCTRRDFGVVGRNSLTGPGLASFNFSFLKTTRINERVSLQFRAEFFNLLNHPNFRLPTTTVFLAGDRRDPTAGRIIATSTSSRQIQFALKFVF